MSLDTLAIKEAIAQSGYAVICGVPELQGRTDLVMAGLLGDRPNITGDCSRSCIENPESVPPSMAPSFGYASYRYKYTFSTVCYGPSDGQQEGDSQVRAWRLAELVADAFRSPMWVPTIPNNATVSPVDIHAPVDAVTDKGVTGVLVRVSIEIEWRV